MNEAEQNKRLGIKIPRSTLLPPYLSTNPYFVEFVDAIDSVFGNTVDRGIDVIANIRNMWVQNPVTEQTVLNHQIVDASQWSTPEREIVVKQVNMLGMKLENAGVVSDDAYQTIARFVGMYWFGKGTQSFIDFINYCLSSDLRIVNMWTEDYISFFEEGDTTIGAPIWEGGTWYPTTHVVITAKGGLQGLDILTLQKFFYEIANYNLVLQAVDSNFDMLIVPYEGDTKTDIVAMGIYDENIVPIANFKLSGAPAPNMHTFEFMPSTYLALGGVDADFVGGFLLAQPDGWMYLDDGVKRVPIYTKSSQTVTDQANVGITLVGDPLPGNQFNLLYGPVTWAAIPGSPKSFSRVPAFSTSATTVKDGIKTSARAVGVQRTMLLTNPLGFVELYPGQFVPYW